MEIFRNISDGEMSQTGLSVFEERAWYYVIICLPIRARREGEERLTGRFNLGLVKEREREVTNWSLPKTTEHSEEKKLQKIQF